MSSAAEPKSLSRLAEAVERDAWIDLCAAAPRDFAERVGLRVLHADGAAIAVMARVDHFQFNRVIGLGVDAPPSPATIDLALETYRAAGVRGFLVHEGPTAPPDLGPALAERGLVRFHRDWVKVHRDASAPAPAPTDLRIEEVPREGAEAFGRVVCQGFGMPELLAPLQVGIVGHPRFRAYWALDGDTPVAAGVLYVKGESAWLGIGATLPSHRRRGGQGALMARRIGDAVALGARHLFTETGVAVPGQPNTSYANMLRAGFAPLYVRANWTPPKADGR
jgi:hypothetical protein